MKIRTMNRRRKIKIRKEFIIKYLMNKYKFDRKDIHVAITENKNGIRYKYYICANESKLVYYYPAFQTSKLHFNPDRYPFGELEHPSVIKNEN